MNLSGINYESIVDGPGVRLVLYISGCRHNCEGCHNPSTFSFSAGKEYTQELHDEIIRYLRDHDYISGITLSGGDPMYSASDVEKLILDIRQEFPAISIWVYSGFTYEQSMAQPDMRRVLNQCDVLVDGMFMQNQRDITLPFRGSSNQRIIDVPASLSTGRAIELEV